MSGMPATTDETRMELTADEQVRIASLTIASTRFPNAHLPEVIALADAIAEWIFLGELPPARPGTSY
jgi:hypothetical protein